MSPWKYADATQAVAVRTNEDGGMESMLASALPEGTLVEPADVAPAQIPQTVSRFQARAALHLAGHLEAVQALMADPATNMLARLAWEDAQEFLRQSPTVLGMGAALGLSSQELDDLFTLAASITA